MGPFSGRETRPESRRTARPTEATICLEAKPVSVLSYEDFVDRLDFLTPRERDRLRLAGGEIFDNLVRHAAPLAGKRLTVRAASRRTVIILGFFFRSPRFASFVERCLDIEPLFDPADRRWRGIGLLMCRNLALSICMKPGTRLDRIFLSFAHENDGGRPLKAASPRSGGESDPSSPRAFCPGGFVEK